MELTHWQRFKDDTWRLTAGGWLLVIYGKHPKYDPDYHTWAVYRGEDTVTTGASETLFSAKYDCYEQFLQEKAK